MALIEFELAPIDRVPPWGTPPERAAWLDAALRRRPADVDWKIVERVVSALSHHNR